VQLLAQLAYEAAAAAAVMSPEQAIVVGLDLASHSPHSSSRST